MKLLHLFATGMFVFLVSALVQAQGAYDKPLKEVLTEIEVRYSVKLSYSDNLVRDKIVSNAFWRFRDEAEATLQLVLGPFDMVFHKNSAGVYEISAFQYHRRPPSEGVKDLQRMRAGYADRPSWEKHREELRTCIQKQLNLMPWPEKSPLNPIYTPVRKHNGYTTENVALETMPGLFLNGTLYRPARGKGPFPAVLLAQGHFELQRYGEEPQIQIGRAHV